MGKIKFIILFLSLFAAACAPRVNIQKGPEPIRNYPVFLSSGEKTAVFKADVSAGDYKSAFLLFLNKLESGGARVRIMGDYSAILLNAVFENGEFSYDYLPKDLFNKTAVSIFEDMVKTLLANPTGYEGYIHNEKGWEIKFRSPKHLNTFFFEPGLSYPYMMKQTKGRINKNMFFNDYRPVGEKPLPYHIVISEEKGRAAIELNLLSIK